MRLAKSEVSEFCTQLTGITPTQAAGEIPFAEPCMHRRKEFQTRSRICASWGGYYDEQRTTRQRNVKNWGKDG